MTGLYEPPCRHAAGLPARAAPAPVILVGVARNQAPGSLREPRNMSWALARASSARPRNIAGTSCFGA